MTIMLPILTSFEQWANDLNRSMPMLVVPTPTRGVKHWWDWVNSLVDLNRLFELPDGDKSTFPEVEDWKKWAYLFIQNAQTDNRLNQ